MLLPFVHSPIGNPYGVITFERSEISKISNDSLSSYLNWTEFADRFWRYFTAALKIDKHLQHTQFLVKTGAELYQLMLENKHELVQRIPQMYIASYLGITPQILIRIRRLQGISYQISNRIHGKLLYLCH